MTHSVTYLLTLSSTDNLKARDASASKNGRNMKLMFLLCSYLTDREASAVGAWLGGSGKQFHVMRDGPFHRSVSLCDVVIYRDMVTL